MSVFVDTSALYSYLDRDESNNARAVEAFGRLVSRERFVTHNYIVVETEP